MVVEKAAGQRRRELFLVKALVLILVGGAMGNAFHLLVSTDLGATAGAKVVPEVALYAAKQAFDAGDVVFVDARSRWQYEAGHIAGALSLPLYEFDEVREAALKDVSKNTTLIIYCVGVTCNSAERLAQRLVAVGFGYTSVFTHGWKVWRDAAHPINEGGGHDGDF